MKRPHTETTVTTDPQGVMAALPRRLRLLKISGTDVSAEVSAERKTREGSLMKPVSERSHDERLAVAYWSLGSLSEMTLEPPPAVMRKQRRAGSGHGSGKEH